MSEHLDIIIPVYNEGNNILKVLRSVRDKVSVPCRVHVVYDFEEDNTLAVLNQLGPEFSSLEVHKLKNCYGPGALNAIKTGLHKTNGLAVLVTMADESDDLIIVNSMFALIKAGSSVVCGSRYMRGGQQIGGPLVKRLLSRIAGKSLYYLTRMNTHDVTNSFKMYRKSLISKIDIESSGGFEIGMEIVTKAYLLKEKITEVPTVWRDRSDGESRFQLWLWLPGYLKWYFRAIFLQFLPAKNSKKKPCSSNTVN